MTTVADHLRRTGAAALFFSVLAMPAAAEPLAYANPFLPRIFDDVVREQPTHLRPQSGVGQNLGDESADVEEVEVPQHLRRQIVSYQTREAPGTIIVDTPNTYLYYVLGGGRAVRYGIGVGREGFTWSGVQNVARKAEWPDWTPPAEMIARQPYLPRWMAGGPGNPMGARAMYLGNTIYRIHGTNQPSSIGKKVSSGCIRMLNDDVVDLYNRVGIGAKVVVLPAGRRGGDEIASRDAGDTLQASARRRSTLN